MEKIAFGNDFPASPLCVASKGLIMKKAVMQWHGKKNPAPS